MVATSVTKAFSETELSGWGRYPLVKTYQLRPEKRSALRQAIIDYQDSGLLARGAGRSYGDAAESSEGLTLLMERLNRFATFDPETGLLRLEAGATIADILATFIPRGWFCPVVPGTKFVTVGGAIAADIHGKNHHRDGSFSSFVKRIWLLTASQEIIECSREVKADIFWATIGGMGLTGVITEAELSLCPIETSYISYKSIRGENLTQLMQLFNQYESKHQYSVAWIDCLAQNNSLGRGVLLLGDHAKLSHLGASESSSPLTVKSIKQITVPVDMPSGLLNRYTMSAFNSCFYASKYNQEKLADYDSFFFPLDILGNWNRMYGKSGFIQYQCVIPPHSSNEALASILSLCSKYGFGSFLAVLKRFGPNVVRQVGSLSFPIPGYTLTLDFPVKSGLFEFASLLDQQVIKFGGRVYLAKDACLSPASFKAMYPGYKDFLGAKRKIDPNNVFASALASRLELI